MPLMHGQIKKASKKSHVTYVLVRVLDRVLFDFSTCVWMSGI